MGKGRKKDTCCEGYKKNGKRCADCPLQGKDKGKKKKEKKEK